ncbi:TetR family transcriptional regulator [Nocardia tenerifensis]|uniref:TetR family transcriptional regulator n=1 Tax=Nocardia tenerifensis TaxID=228006 RepID=A0A318K3G7_9NOCA|nr:TetR/AcrR family transcriptional regulator [Nocardia tenerifensis]PXX63014.1 TetR family transcriptional regulator [Nocardia tenerifensis]
MTEPATSARQLPRGRHGLPREQVVASQRERILIAMAEAMLENGYVGTSVAAILKRAGVSRETFYEQFRSKEACFEAAYERAVQNLLGRIEDASNNPTPAKPDRDSMAKMDRIFAAYLQHLVDDPASARLYLVEVYAVGSAALSRRAQLQELFVGLIADVLGAGTDEQRFACQTLAAAISAMVTGRIAADDLDGLLALRVPLLNMVRRGGVLYGDALAVSADSRT